MGSLKEPFQAGLGPAVIPGFFNRSVEISQGRLLSVVKALGTYLTSEQYELRTKGVDFLAAVIGRCQENSLNRQSVKVLTVFFCDKLDDTETIVPALKGLSFLSRLPTCSSNDALVMLNGQVFTHVKMRALVQSVRFHVFSIIDGLIANHRETLKSMKSDFVVPYIRLAEGEKDPRNLLLAFAIARVILIEFDPTEHIEALSNIIFCYFPITFRPPPNDPYGITADDLRIALRGCLSATPAFGTFCDADFSRKTRCRRDTLEAMSVCFPVYGPALARVNARKLWNALKLEIFQPTDTATEEEALKTIQALVKTIYADEEQDDDVQGLARDVCEECIQILREPEKSQAKPAIKVLCAFMATTPSVSRYTLSHAVPHLLKLFADPNEVPSRHPILLLLSDLIAAARDSAAKSTTPEADPPLAPFKDEVLGALISGVTTLVTTRAALAGLTGLVSTKDLLSDTELGFVVLKVNDVLKMCYDEEHSDDSNAILKLLMTISSISPSHVRDQTLPLLLGSLPEIVPPRNAASERARYQHVLSALSTLCGPAPLFETLVTQLYPRLTALAFSTEPDVELHAAYLHALLIALKRTLAAKVDEGHADVAGYADTLVPRLYGTCVRAALHGGPATEPRVVSVVGDIIVLITQSLAPPRQQVFATALFSVFLTGNIAAICEGEHVKADDLFFPFTAEATVSQRNLILLFEAGVVPLHPTASQFLVTIDQDINACTETILVQGLAHADNERQAEAVFHVVGSLVNKHVDELETFLEHKKTTAGAERRRQAIKVPNHTLAHEFINRLFEVFGDGQISTYVAKAFGEIAASDSILTKRNSAVVKFLWAQKFANGILPRLMNGAKVDSTVLQHAHLIALTALIKSIPTASYSHEMPQLMPLFLRALQLPDAQIRAGVLETLLGAAAQLSSTHAVLAEHAPALVRLALAYTSTQITPTSARIRIAALRCLGVLPGVVRYDVLHPSKATVLRELAEALDDPKRSVRREAVDARFKYNG
ncbi:Dos2-interacting transcription regulator of RNA-Pol-II-domain-containing protein [Mycena sp. CBHHK59/15]|nr:Dos2-interacting transcription regulator of RNA-Pol-II-domain-containing protein [Mycena sp. CBHHK59/15]